MMGERTVAQEALFYSFNLERHVPADHLLRSIDRFVDLSGIREHLHFHLVPRWTGDSSFMAVFDEVRTMPEHLSRTYAALKPYFTNGAANGKQDRAASTPGQEGCGS